MSTSAARPEACATRTGTLGTAPGPGRRAWMSGARKADGRRLLTLSTISLAIGHEKAASAASSETMCGMEDIPPGARSARFAAHGPVPAPAAPEPVEFTDEQKREVARALYEAEVEVLRAIARSAGHADTNYAARSTVRLTHALATLRVAAGQAQSRSPFFPGPPPWAMGPEGMEDFGEP